MRWLKKNTHSRSSKTKTFFALFPVRIGDEIRWLERVTIVYILAGTIDVDGGFDYYWKKYEFIDKEES